MAREDKKSLKEMRMTAINFKSNQEEWYNLGGISKMIWRALVLAAFIGSAVGYPLYGDNGLLNCSVYGSYKEPLAMDNVNYDRYMILDLDLSLRRVNASIGATQAVYTLMDRNDRSYKMSPEYTRSLQQNRLLISFVVPIESIPKSLVVDPSSDPEGGKPFSLGFPEPINASDSNATMVYYGITGFRMDTSKRSLRLDVSVTNNGTANLPLSSKNFTLIDQWGWTYGSKEYDSLTREGISAVVLPPNGTMRAGLFFTSLSPLSRPVELVYKRSPTESLSLNIDPEKGSTVINSSTQGCPECCQPQAADSTNLAGSIKATKSRLAKVREDLQP
jgi:hypothetical protein